MRNKGLVLALVLIVVVAAVLTFTHVSRARFNPNLLPRQANSLITTPVGWALLRDAAAEDQAAATALTTVDMCWTTAWSANYDASTYDADPGGVVDVYTSLSRAANAVEIAFFDPCNVQSHETFDFELWAWRDASAYGPGKLVYKTTSAANHAGTMACLKHPITGVAQPYGNWVDTISGTDYWPTGVTITNSGTDQVAVMTFDLMGHRYLRLIIYNAAGTSTECVAVGAVISGY